MNQQFSFSPEFQCALFHMALDDSLSPGLLRHIKPNYFTSDPLGWAWGKAERLKEEYGRMPTLLALLEECHKLDQALRPVYEETLRRVQQTKIADYDYVRAETAEWVKRNIFSQAMHQARDLYNSGAVEDSYQRMQTAQEEMKAAEWVQEDRGWFFEETSLRQDRRIRDAQAGLKVPTGIPALDSEFNLDGGLGMGELGIWIAYPKVGKSALLANLGAAAAMSGRKVLHLVFEGSRGETEDRYEACIARQRVRQLKRGHWEPGVMDLMEQTYASFRHNLVITAMTDWEHSVLDIEAEMKELQRRYNWKPEVIVIDYGDLVQPREKHTNTFESQKSVFRDLKTLAKRGHCVWTASQAQRAKEKKFDETEHLLKSNQIAECFEKVRVADFIGSINQTKEEKTYYEGGLGRMRLNVEMYRANGVGNVVEVCTDLKCMAITGDLPRPAAGKVDQSKAPPPNKSKGASIGL